MDSRSLAEQEKDIRDLLRRAERTPVKTSALRRDTLKRLIDLAHSSYPSLKVIAATNLKLFIKDFPELEDEAINAVYDLCEDTVSNVRIKGYAAIVDVSREQSKWVKRNADVLVQLLQSDEAEEVTFVKRALTQHLDMDPVVTLGVLCDQLLPQEEPLDEEEQNIRDRLRSLVLSFLANEAKRPLVERHANTAGTPGEQALVTGLFKAITKLSPNEVDIIVKDIIASLPSFKSSSLRGKELLDIILAQIRATLKLDLAPGVENASLSGVRYHLDLASFVAVDKRLAPPSHLLRFYYASLTPKLILTRLVEEDQAYVMSAVAQTFAACEEGPRSPPTAPAADIAKVAGASSDDDATLKRPFPNICVVLLQVFVDMKSYEHRPWSACHTLVQGLARRKRDIHWQIPQHVTSVLRRVESLPVPPEGASEAKAAQEQVHSVIRQSLLGPVKPPVAPATSAKPSSANSNSVEEHKGNVSKVPNGNATGDAHTMNGMSDIAAPKDGGGPQTVANTNKRKLDSPNGPTSSGKASRLGGGPNGSKAPTSPLSRNGTPGRPASLPPRPSAATVASSIGGTPNAPRADRQRQPPPHLKDKATPRPSPPAHAQTTAGPSTAGDAPAPGSSTVDEGITRSAKKSRVEGRGARDSLGAGSAPANNGSTPGGSMSSDVGKAQAAQVAAPSQPQPAKAVPSLLSRLAGSIQNGKAPALPRDREQPLRDRERDRGGQGRRNKRDRDSEKEKEEPSKSTSLPSIIPAKRRGEESVQPQRSVSSSALQSSSTPRSRPPPPRSTDTVPTGGYSILGAAKAASRGANEGGKKGFGSLLERMQARTDSSSDGAGRNKKRPRHQA